MASEFLPPIQTHVRPFTNGLDCFTTNLMHEYRKRQEHAPVIATGLRVEHGRLASNDDVTQASCRATRRLTSSTVATGLPQSSPHFVVPHGTSRRWRGQTGGPEIAAHPETNRGSEVERSGYC